MKLTKQSRPKLPVALVFIFVAVARLGAQEQTTSHAANDAGRQTFARSCSGCHGLDGKGTQRAPSIAAGSRASQLAEGDLLRIVAKGVPERGMPAFEALGSDQMSAVVKYVRMLSGVAATTTLPGVPERGKKLFFGEGGCSQCHMMQGAGGFIAPDLSGYARGTTPKQVRTAITKPEGVSRAQLASVATTDGQHYEGMIRNEDNFSLQLQTLDGGFHFFSKAGLKAIERKPATTMHQGFGSRFSASQLDDLVSYILSSGTNSLTKAGSQEGDEQ